MHSFFVRRLFCCGSLHHELFDSMRLIPGRNKVDVFDICNCESFRKIKVSFDLLM